MNQSFLCQKHREKLAKHPNYARQICCQLLATGRHYLNQGQWKESVSLFGSAFETAEILLVSDPCPIQAISRYINIAEGFIFALRKSPYPADLQALLALVESRLEATLPPRIVANKVTALYEVAFSPISEMASNMRAWSSIEPFAEPVLH